MRVICPDTFECELKMKCAHRIIHKYTNECDLNCKGNDGYEIYAHTSCCRITKKINALIVLKRLK